MNRPAMIGRGSGVILRRRVGQTMGRGAVGTRSTFRPPRQTSPRRGGSPDPPGVWSESTPRPPENPPSCATVSRRMGKSVGTIRRFEREMGLYAIGSSYVRHARERGLPCVVVRGRVLPYPDVWVREWVRNQDGRPEEVARLNALGVSMPRESTARPRPSEGSASGRRRVRPSARGRGSRSGRTCSSSSRSRRGLRTG